MKVFSFLKVFDRFKRPVLLYSNNSKNHSTRMGVVVSMMIYLLLLYYFISCDMITRKNPKTSDQTVESSFRPEISLKSIVFDISDNESVSYVDPTIFSFQGSVRYLRVNEASKNGFEYTYNLEEQLHLCSEEDFEKGVFEKLGLRNKFCFGQKNIKLKGYWDEKEIKYVSVKLQRCENRTENGNTCKSKEVIDQFFATDKYFNIYFFNPFIDLNDYNNPIKNIWRNEYQILDPELLKDVNLYFKKLDFKDDRNFPFVSPSFYELYSFDKRENDVSFSRRGSVLLETTIYSSILIQKKERIYQGLPEVFGNLGGLFGICLFVGFIITSPEFRLNMILGLFSERVSFNDGLELTPLARPEEKDPKESFSRDRAKSEQRPHSRPPNIKLPFEKFEERKKDADIPFEEHSVKKKEILSPYVFPNLHPSREPNIIRIYEEKLGRTNSFSKAGKTRDIELGAVGGTKDTVVDKSLKNEDEIGDRKLPGLERLGSQKETLERKDYDINTINEALDKKIIITENAEDNIDLLPIQNNKPSKSTKKTQSKYSSKALENTFSFNILEYFIYQTKKVFGCELTEKQKFFRKLEKKYTEDLNVGIILQRIFLLESKVEFIFTKLENIRPSVRKRQVGMNCTLYDLVEK